MLKTQTDKFNTAKRPTQTYNVSANVARKMAQIVTNTTGRPAKNKRKEKLESRHMRQYMD